MIKFLIFGGFLFIIGLLIGAFAGNFGITGKAVQNYGSYEYTRAVCNTDKECIDVLIKCEDGEVAEIQPVSELKRFDEDWKDARNSTEFCG